VSDQFITALLQETSHNAASSVVIIIVSYACEIINKILLPAKVKIMLDNFQLGFEQISLKNRLPLPGKRF